jgi:formylglycine-generating enzyme required for sulfatase activity
VSLPPGTYWAFVGTFSFEGLPCNAPIERRYTVTLAVTELVEICDNGADDDGDGLIDCADPDCEAFPACGGLTWATVLEVAPDPTVVTDPEWRERIVAAGLPWRVQDNASGIEMLLIPPGTFDMGCSPSNQYGCNIQENPVHEVTLTQAFYLGRYEVTQAQWTAVMGSNPSEFQDPSNEVPVEQVPNRPVEQVSWNMIQGFEAATGLRMPTEAEWEYACRAGTQTAFNLPPNGTNDDGLLGQLGWFNSNSASQTRPVGQKQANNLGFHDMHGNVYEWVEDWFGSGYYAESPAIDPSGPPIGTFRVLRGGGWSNGSVNGRASHRFGLNPGNVYYYDGFRAARTP